MEQLGHHVPLSDVRAAVAELLGAPAGDLTDTEDLTARGLDSIRVMRMASWFRRRGVALTFRELLDRPVLSEWCLLAADRVVPTDPTVEPPPVDPGAVFALTPVQHAYWIGRRDDQVLGGVGCHVYLEFDGTGVDPARLDAAVRELTCRHPMLRARFHDDGGQQVSDRSGWPGLRVHDLSGQPADLVARRLDEIRSSSSHRRLQVRRGEVFDVQLSLLPAGATRVHLNVDLLVADVTSIHLILADLATCYVTPDRPGSQPEYGFAHYLAQRAGGTGAERERARRYWAGRLDDLPDGPRLPLAVRPERISRPHFTRHTHRLTSAGWERFAAGARRHGLTPATALATAYAEVLAAWSEHPRFLLNVPLFDRQQLGPAVAGMVADFTNLTLLAVDLGSELSFSDQARRVQDQLRADVTHAAYSGVEVLRDLARADRTGPGGDQWGQRAPVVFACNIGAEFTDATFRRELGELSWMISQTPQVWLDHQVYEMNGELVLCWDVVAELFPPGLTSAMFAAYTTLVDRLATHEPAWTRPVPDLLPADQRDTRDRANATSAAESGRLLHEAFFLRAAEDPERTALLWGRDGTMSYGALAERALAVAAGLLDSGLCAGEPVAVTLPRGPDQVVAVLAVLAAGGVYVPVGVEEPAPRRRRIASGAGIGRALTSTSGGGPSGWPTTVDVLRIEHARGRAPLPAPVPRAADAPAYVIFTSGSTGEPKGVEVTHRSAVNTVEDINDRFGIGPNDRVLAISALDFDLSVYDIFGLLGTGGAVVLADENARRDPGRAHDLLERHSVTLWNSVPVLLDMLLSTGLPVPASLRLALLSGDWIGLDLPGRLADQSGHRCRLVALGGATEAAIWSNALEVGQVPAGWPSVPYGFPLRNQRYRVADQRGRDCPDWVPGELWIGGTGVATGYRGDPAQTSLRFVEYRGLRWYRTGDRGRYRPGGILEFLGRTDRQVKIRGQRVELGEVEAALRTHPDVGQGAAVAVGEPARRLVAVVTPRPGMPGSPDPADVETVETVDGTVAEAEAHLVETVLARLMSRGAFDRAAGPDVPEWTDTLLRLWSDWLTSRSVLDGAPGDRPGHHATRLDALLDSANGEALRLRVGGTHLEVVLTRLEERLDDLAAMVRGDLDPLTLLDDPVLAPEALADLDPGTAAATAAMGRAIAETAGCGPLRIAELGARSGRAAGQLADALAPAEFEYTLLDASSTLLAAARDRLAGAPHRFGYRAMAEGWVPADLRYRFDVVVARHWLHVHADLATGVGVAAMLLAPGGSLLALERTRFSPLALISAALIDHGVLGRTVPAGEWRRLLVLSGLDRPATSEDRHGLLHLRARRPADAPTPHPDHIRRWVADRLPASMVPEQVLVQPRLPLTANGKVDRATVTRMLSEQDYPVGTERGEPPRGEVECRVAEVWAELLGVERPGRGHDFFALGGDSLLATRMVGRLRGAGLRAELSRLFAFPVLGDFAATLTRGAEPGPLTVTEDLAHRHEPFAPTEVQRAYWLGRHEGIALGGAAAHYYCEFDGPGLDLDRFTEACNRLIARHEMLRAVFDEQGNQRILPEVPRFRIPVTPADSDCGGAGRALDALRATMSHQVRDPSSWPLLDVRAVCYRKCGESRVRLGVSLDNLVLDGLSMMIVFAELSTFYHGLDASLPPVRMSFRDYLIQTVPSGQARESAERYWTGRLADLPGPPRLPLAADPATVRAPRFTRRSGRVEPRRWRAITARARAHGLTPSAVLLACYAEVLGRWSGRGDLTVNVTLFDRRDVHPDVRNVLGDFTSLLLVAYQPVVGESFLAAARRVQEQQGRDLDHRDVSATWVLRELRRNATVGAAAMPVVFTSALGMAGGMSLDLSDWLLPRIWGVSQTPQVWLDNQVYESHGGLCYDWDAAEQVVPADVLDAMFGAYSRLLDWLGAADWSEPVPDLLPSAQLAVRTRANATAGPIPDAPLHQGFFTHAAAHPDATACLWDGGRLSFGALAERALRVAARLRRCGISAADTVAVTLPRGPDQIVAVLGVLAAGAAYVPVGVDQPPMRRDRMYRACGARLVLADSAVTTTAAVVLTPADTARDRPLDAPVLPCPDAPAYVIFTSGSTGEPKGVEVTHRSAVNTVHDVNARFGVGPTDRVLAVSALDFDLSVYDIFGMLTAGAALVLLGDDERRDARRWRELADRHGVTVWNSTPTLLEMLLVAAGDGGMPRDLRVALVSGDWVGVDLKARMDALGSTCRLVALGGATEAAIWSNAFEVGHVPARWTSIPYGFPLRNQCFRVVDAHRRDCPDRVVGELWIGGLGLATGYRGDPARTAESFVTDAGRRWYRTGDLGRYWPDGTLEFLGRMDQQVKIGGHRVELGEVEAALTEHPAVRDAVAVATGDRGRRRLAAFVVPKDPRTGSADCLASLPAFLAERLPAHSVPDRLGILDEVPLTSHGKVDRTAVLAGADALPDGRGEPARGAVEEAVAGIWSELLGVPVRRNHNFFALGGDSLLATGLVGRLRAQGFGGAGLGDLFDAPVLADFAARITPSSPGPPGLPGQPGEPRPTSGAVVVLPDPEHRHEPFPATELQRAYWVGRSDQFWLGGVGSHYYCEYDETDLDLPRLEEAWNRLIARHEMLRAVFDEHGDQRVLPTVDRFRISVQTADDDADGALAALRDRMSHQVLDPSRWPLFDVRAVRYGANQTRIGISLDYLLVDGLSMMILFTELDRLYADLDADLPSTGVSFRDYVGQVAPDPEATARAERYWRRRIPELPPAPQLPVARDPAVLGRPRFVRRESWLPPRKWDALRAGARRHGVTPSTLLLACFAEVLGAWSARADLTVCLTVFDRRDVHPDINHILGDFTSLLLVAHQPEPGEAWSVRVRRLHEQVGRDLDHRDTSAVWVLREMARADGADAARMPVVFTSALGVEDTLSNRIRRPVWSVAQTPQVCLDQQVMERAGGLSLTWDVVEDLYPPGVIDAMFSAQQRLLDWASGSDWSGSPPDPLPAEQRAVRLAVNDTAGPVPQGTLHGEFFRHARADPARVALAWGSAGRMSYGELADQALRIATALRRRGVTAGDPVAVSLPKRPGQIAAVLGVLAAGGVYVPVGVDQPPVRRERILATAGTRLVLTAGSHPERGTVGGESVALPDALSCPPASAPLPVEPDALAYVIFTSGSTGEPKGVEVTHRSAANTVHDVNARFGVGPTDRVLAVSALDFDLSVYDIFGMLTAGAALVLLDDDERADPGRWLDLAGRHRVSIWNSVPALLDMLLDAAADRRLPTLRLALVSGDRVGLDLAPRLAAWSPETRLVALGGATEAAIWSNHYRVTGVPEHGTSVPYGFPLGNQRYRVVDAEGRDRPDWAAGELWIGGLGVARGYRGDAEQTRRRFVQAGGERWYRTGDIGRYWPDGTLEFLGRADQQVKIRGHRVELGEIEAALASHPDVRAAVAVVAPDVGQPVAFVVPAGCPPDPGALAAFLAERLPSYAVPIRYHIVEDLPLTANGKVDRPRLVSLARPQSPIGTAHSGPRGDTERVLAGLWADLLGVDDVPRDASFFALGGDSLLAARLTSRIRDRLGADVALRTLFAAPTVAELAPLIEPRTGTGDSDDLEEGIL